MAYKNIWMDHSAKENAATLTVLGCLVGCIEEGMDFDV